MKNIPESLSVLTENSISDAATEGFVNGAVSGAMETAFYGGKLGERIVQGAFMTAAGNGAGESTRVIWGNVLFSRKVEASLAKLPPGLTTDQAAVINKLALAWAAADSIAPAATLLGAAAGAGVGYLIGGKTGAAVGAVIGGGYGFYSSGLSIRARIGYTAEKNSLVDGMVRNLSETLGSKIPIANSGSYKNGVMFYGDVSASPKFFGMSLNSLSFSGNAWGFWDFSSGVFDSTWSYDFLFVPGLTEYDRSIPLLNFHRGGDK